MYNKITIIGNIGQEPQTRVLQNGQHVTSFSVATTKKWKDDRSESGWSERTEWHKVTLWGKLAEYFNCEKGDCVLVEGEMIYKEYVDQTGRKHSLARIPEINASTVSRIKRRKNIRLPQEAAPQDISNIPPDIDDLPF